MKVAIVADPYVAVPPMKYGGTEYVISNIIKGLQEQGHEPILLAAGNSEVDCELIPITPKALGFAKSKAAVAAHNRKVAHIARNTEAILRKLIKQKRVDVIHSHSYIESAFDLRKFADFPNVTTMHNPVLFRHIDYYESRADLNFVSISKNQQEAFPSLSYAGVVYNGEDPSDFPIVTEPEDYVCFLGRFDRKKNPHFAIQLAISVGMPIKVAGKIDHESEGYFQEEVEPYLSHPLVEYLGELNFEEKVEMISKAKCNLHPTGFREPFGLTVIEAAYCGTPTLAIKRGAMSELIEEDRTGILVEDFIEGYHKLESCFDLDRLYTAKRSRSLFNYKVMAAEYVKAYETVIQWNTERKKAPKTLREFAMGHKDELRSLLPILSLGDYHDLPASSRQALKKLTRLVSEANVVKKKPKKKKTNGKAKKKEA
jgi:glycosyltransferase involved in cell wall biosynthesis